MRSLLPPLAATLAVGAFLGIFSPPVLAAETCSGLLKQSDIDACLQTRYESTSETVADAFEALLASATQPELHAYLIDGQAAWTAARDAACDKKGADYEGGSMQQSVILDCLGDANESRTKQILAVIDQGLRAKGYDPKTAEVSAPEVSAPESGGDTPDEAVPPPMPRPAN